jgi:glucose/arabinose dehydrogenase
MRQIQSFFATASLFALAISCAAAPSISTDPYITGLTRPVFITHAGDSSGRLYILEKNVGRIRIFQKSGTTGTLLATPLLDIGAKVNTGNEEGLLGLAFHPSYSSNGRFFVYYTNTSGDNQLSEFQRSVGDPNIADATETTVLTLLHPGQSNHNGGCIMFGPDGYLYIGTGDGGGGGDPFENAQNTNSLLGKLLRIDVNSTTSTYTVPADNPFVGVAGADEIYAYGLRNPWRYSFDSRPGGTNRLFLGDVGQSAWEEVDIITKGGNYGWDDMEGFVCYEPSTGCLTAGRTLPINVYDHSLGFSITGGYVYRGSQYPYLYGRYIFADYVTGRVWALTEGPPDTWTRIDLATLPFQISSFGEDEDGELFVIEYVNDASTNSRVHRLKEVSRVADYHLY